MVKKHHLGHRQRLRKRFMAAPDSLADYELLELLLTYALPRHDTKPPAKEILARFGSLDKALMADPAALSEIPGLGPATVTFWTALRECLLRKAAAPIARRETFSTPEQVRELVQTRLGGLTKEEFWVILVDSQNRLIRFEQVSRGTVDQTTAYPREILELALRHHASGLILVHNHPGGSPNPSRQDQELTSVVSRLSVELGLRLLDHLIVTSDDFTSFRSLGLL
jgi:DNA repair protein RadC